MKKKYLVFADNKHEYTIKSVELKDGNTKHTLYYSHGEQWADRLKGTKTLTIIEGDLEIEIVDQTKGMVCYSEIDQLRLLLNFITRDYKNDTYSVIEEKNIIKLK